MPIPSATGIIAEPADVAFAVDQPAAMRRGAAVTAAQKDSRASLEPKSRSSVGGG